MPEGHVAKRAQDNARRRTARTALALVTLLVIAGGVTALGAGRQGADVRGAALRSERFAIQVSRGGEDYTVDVMMQMRAGSSDAAARAAKGDFLREFPGTVAATSGNPTQHYVLEGYYWPTRTVTWSYNPAGKPDGLTDDQAAIARGAEAWSHAGVDFRFAGGQLTSATTGACDSRGLDGVNTVGWVPLHGSVLAITCVWYRQTGSPREAAE